MAETRIPPKVQKTLRKEVGFVCPYPDCGSPFLTFHHFDPPRHIEDHNRPEGMIALCREHHGFADQGHYAKEQLREWKQSPLGVINTKRQRLAWLQREPLVVVGSVYTRRVADLLEFRGRKSLWLTTDDSGFVLFNLSMASFSNDPMVMMEDNCWQYDDLPFDVLCPPGGKRLKITYTTGDYLDLVYTVFDDPDALEKKHPAMTEEECKYLELSFPVTVLVTKGRFGDGRLMLMPKQLKLGDAVNPLVISGTHADRCGCIMNLSFSGFSDVILEDSFYKNSSGPILRVRE